jgi:hypothetical protein
MAWNRYAAADWPPDDWLARDPRPWWGWTVAGILLVFLLGGAAGYFARDLRPAPEITRYTEDVLQNLERAATSAWRGARRVGGAVRDGVRAAAESAKAILN